MRVPLVLEHAEPLLNVGLRQSSELVVAQHQDRLQKRLRPKVTELQGSVGSCLRGLLHRIALQLQRHQLLLALVDSWAESVFPASEVGLDLIVLLIERLVDGAGTERWEHHFAKEEVVDRKLVSRL